MVPFSLQGADFPADAADLLTYAQDRGADAETMQAPGPTTTRGSPGGRARRGALITPGDLEVVA